MRQFAHKNKVSVNMKAGKKIGLVMAIILGAFFSCKKEKNNTSDDSAIAVGKTYQGGIIFYVDGTGSHGLVAAAEDQSAGISWYNSAYLPTNATDLGVGKGLSNTNTIVGVQGSGSYAASLCKGLNISGYNDWFLPSKEELSLLYQQRSSVGGFADDYYWSSSEYDTINSWYLYFPYGPQYVQKKDIKARVRAIRAF